MRIPKWKGTRPVTYIFSLVCFFVGITVVTAFSFARVTYDDREGPSMNPVSRMPDGRIGLGEFTIDCIGFVVLMIPVGLYKLAEK